MKCLPIRFQVVGAILLISLTSFGCGGASMQSEKAFDEVGKELGGQAAPDEPVRKVAFQPNQPVKQTERKIIYTARLRMITDDLDKLETKLLSLVNNHKGHVANSVIQGATGSLRTGTWKIRVPANEFKPLRDELVNLGEPQENALDSQEVTDEYYDLKTRIKNAKAYEDSVRKLLEEKTKEVKYKVDVLKLLEEARTKVELLEGRYRRLMDQVALSTINLTVTERIGYVPAQAPSFGTTIGRTFQGSIDALVTFGQALVLIFVAVLPWLVVLLIIAVPCCFLLRIWWRRINAPVQVIAVPPAGDGSSTGDA